MGKNSFAGGHLIMDVLTTDKSTINNESMVSEYLNRVTDIIGLTAITPAYVFKFPFSSEKFRLLEKIEKYCKEVPPELQKEIDFAKKLKTEDCGVSGTITYAESHSAIHGWDEVKINGSDGGVTIDIFSCNTLDYEKVIKFTEEHFKALKIEAIYLDRYFDKPQEIKQFTIIKEN